MSTRSREGSMAAFLELCCETSSGNTFGRRPIPPLAVAAYAFCTSLHFGSLEEFDKVSPLDSATSYRSDPAMLMTHRPTGLRVVVKPVVITEHRKRTRKNKPPDDLFISPGARCATQGKMMAHHTAWLPDTRLLNTVYTVLDSADEKKKGQRFIVSQYRPGGSLADLLAAVRRSNGSGCLSEEGVRFYVAQLALIIDVFQDPSHHHLDELKLERALLDEKGYCRYIPPAYSGYNTNLPEDFTHAFTGEINIVSPELLQFGANHTDPTCLWWVLGCLLVKLATGKQAFYGRTMREVVRQITEASQRRFPDFERNREMHDLVTNGLLVNDRARRIGSLAELQAHPFFDGFDWKALQREEMTAPSDILEFLSEKRKPPTDKD